MGSARMSRVRVFVCPFLDPPEVELTDEREEHIRARHPDLLPTHLDKIEMTIREPDDVRPDLYYPDKKAFIRWFPDLGAGKFLIVQVVTDWGNPDRHWIVTAYLDSVSAS